MVVRHQRRARQRQQPSAGGELLPRLSAISATFTGGCAQLYYDPDYGWTVCTDSNPVFEIKFYQDDGGAPGIEVCSYTMTPHMTNTGIMYAGFVPLLYYTVDLLEPCCTLSDGWVSIQGFGDADCWFMWLSASTGDGSSYFKNDGTPEAYFYDNSLCLTGEYVLIRGACCDDGTGICEDDVEQMDCAGRFAANTLCTDLDPACGVIPGACCHPDGTCDITEEVGCEDNWLGPYTICNACPGQVLRVDDDGPSDPGPGDPTISDPLEDGSAEQPVRCDPGGRQRVRRQRRDHCRRRRDLHRPGQP